MPDRTVHRLDERGAVRDWLVAGAWGEPADDLHHLLAADGSPWGEDGRWALTNGPDATPLKRRLYARRPLRREQDLPEIAEGGPVAYAGPYGTVHEDRWRRVHTGADGLVDWSRFCPTPEYRLALAACVLEVDQAERRVLRLATTGPSLLYVAGECVSADDTVTYMEPAERAVQVRLPSGTTPVVVASWQVAFRECRQVLRLAVDGLPVRVVLPSPGADERVAAIAEQVLAAVGTPTWGTPSGDVTLTGPPGAALRVTWDDRRERVRLTNGTARLSLGGGDEPGAAPPPATGKAGKATAAGKAEDEAGGASAPATGEAGEVGEVEDEAGGALAPEPGKAGAAGAAREVLLRVAFDDDRAPVFREFPVAVLPREYRAEPVGEPCRWRAELLAHAAGIPAVTAAELARAELDATAVVRPESLDRALWMIGERADCADFEAVGLLNLWHRVPPDRWPAGLRDTVRTALTGLKYWIDQPGLDAMCYFTENHQLVWHTAEILAGEAFAGEVFAGTGWTGAAHAAHGRALAWEWIARRLAGGFSEFDSNAYLAIDTLALTSLVEFCADTALTEPAAGLLDKLLFTLGVNSWRGVHGSAHGRCYVQSLRSSRLEETAPIMWLVWGVGALGDMVLPATVLATARRYRVPDAVRAAGRQLPEEWLGRQHYAGSYRFDRDLLSRPYESSTVIYRTPDAMLSCAEDHRAGLPGLQEHVWGATLGPETQIFVNHPANAAVHSSARPGAWTGNRVLPRARQHRDTVLALYRIPPGDPMGHTHAWFPLSHTDEWRREGDWIAARRGDGYVALATEGGVRVTTTGPDANAELRPYGPGRAWVCTIGRRATDGPFADFAAALGNPEWDDASVTYTTRHGTRLALDWDGPFTVDGHPADLDANGLIAPAYHLDNPLCRVADGDTEMRITVGDLTHVIDLQHGRKLTP